MDVPTTDDLKALIDSDYEGPHISIYMPTETKGAELQQNPIRFKNQLHKVEARLKEMDIDEASLAPAHDLLADQEFWQHQHGGLAMFLAGGEVRVFRLPISVPEQVLVNDRFLIKPLLSLSVKDGLFYILALSQNQIRLFKATRYTVEPIELGNIPESMAEALWFLEVEKQVGYNSGTSQPGAARASKRDGGGIMFFGSGEEPEEKVRIHEFFNIVDKGIRGVIGNATRVPLVLAGVEYLHPIYEEESEYPQVITGQIIGNPEMMSPHDLHEKAWTAVESLFTRDYEQARETYAMHSGREDGLAAQGMEEIVAAAVYQRIAVLFVNPDEARWGSFDAATGEMTLHNGDTPEGEDLLDLAVVHTLLNGGTVYSVAPADLPEGQPAAAVLRF